MTNILRTLVLTSAVMAAAALASTPAMADSRLNVPFSFTADGKTLPAGQYSVSHEIGTNLVILKNRETSHAFTWIVGPGDPSPNDMRVVLRFDETGDTHALRSIQYESQITPRLDKKNAPAESDSMKVTSGR